MEAEKTSRAPSSRRPTGFPPRRLEEHHHSSALVGRIVEKGFSSTHPGQNPAAPTSFPQPTVLPFPVARHRSHGPHWAPVATAMDVDEDKVEEDKDAMDYGSAASLARPIQKKKKKGLDFSKWKEIVPGEPAAASVRVKKKQESTTPSKFVEEEMVKAVAPVAATAAEEYLKKVDRKTQALHATEVLTNKQTSWELHTDSTMELTRSEGSEQGDFDFQPAIEPAARDVGADTSSSTVDQQGNPSLIDDIDAENLARLRQMSPDEIAEAQAEIMEKMDPALLEMLKKRGLNKLGGRTTEASNKDKRPGGSQGAKQVEVAKGSHKEESTPVVGDWLSSSVHDGRSWKTWCDRVEKARALRFSLDGNVVGNDSSQEPANGDVTEFSQYNPENVTERDFLRTEGDPSAAGYTIEEAVALIRSMIPGQRALALQLLASVLDKSLHDLQQMDATCMRNINPTYKFIDWQAVWAYILGPKPEIALSLRIALDDNHNSVILACAKVVQCILSCDINENFFNISEKLCTYEKDVYTAPVFRSRPEVDFGFLCGGFWKYSTKPSNILPFNDKNEDDENEEKHTIQDDIVVSGQDVAAGLVRMGILPRICYLLEMDPLPPLEECLVFVLIALARHSPACVNSIMKCPRLIETVVHRFTEQGTVEVQPSKIKTLILLKVLSQSDKQNCLEFIKRGFFQETMWHMYKNATSLDHWIKSGKEHCKLTSSLMVEQLRFWKVCIRYGYCISYFADFFPAMCMWLSPPTFDKLIERNVLGEFASVAREAYHVLEALSQRLPRLHSMEQIQKQVTEFSVDMETWSWSHVGPAIELAIRWFSLKDIPLMSFILDQQKDSANHAQNPSVSCMLWVISAVLHMLSSIFDRIAPKDTNGQDKSSTHLPWLPFFVPKVGLEIVKNGFLNFLGPSEMKHEGVPAKSGSLVDGLCRLRRHNDLETSLSSVSCLHGLVQLTYLVDRCIQNAKVSSCIQPPEGHDSGINGKILEVGIVKWAQNDLIVVRSMFMNLVALEWQDVQSVEMFGRGGPAPGIGQGWGSSGGGFWSTHFLLAQMDAQLILSLLDIFPVVLEKDLPAVGAMKPMIGRSFGEMTFNLQRINAVLGICLVAGPRERFISEKALDILLQAPVLKYLNFCMCHFLHVNKGLKSFDLQYKDEDYLHFSNLLNAHFRNMWLSIKGKSTDKVDKTNNNQKAFKKNDTLETIHEDLEATEMADKYPDLTSLQIEWAHQKLPLPVHWFLSPISCIGDGESAHNLTGSSNTKYISICSSHNRLDVAKSGLFILFGLEATSCFESHDSPISVVPLVWKLHALSMALLAKMDVLEDEKSRDIYETLQELYGQHIDRSRSRNIKPLLEKNENVSFSSETFLSQEALRSHGLEFLDFQTQIHESYTTFIETFIEQFGAISYGNILYGRQVALYLHRSVEVAVRLAAWNALSNAHVLELLPPLGKCFAETEGYLEPIEDNEGVLEAYVKSWISGALDRAATRGSMSFTLALHHLSCFIFNAHTSDKLPLRNKLAKSLLRGYSRKQHHKGMLSSLIQYKLPIPEETNVKESTLLQESQIKRRFEILSEACEGNSSLLAELEKLKPF